MIDDISKQKQLSKWIVFTVTCCILVYLFVSNFDSVINIFYGLFNITKPIVIGLVFALILNVPMSLIERKVFRKNFRGKRSLSIFLSLIFIIAIAIGVMVLVIPELVAALKLLVGIASDTFSQLSQMKQNIPPDAKPWVAYLAQIDMDWSSLKVQLEDWFKAQSESIANQAFKTISALTSGIVTLVLSLFFAIYILARKEELKRQTGKLVRTWLPEKGGSAVTHVFSTFSTTFQKFIGGQATEAVILGVLCTLGMLILRLPYAPMIGALVGVTALIPIVGGFVGTIVGGIMIVTVAPVKALIFIVFLLVLQQIEGNLIYPRVVGGKISLPAIWVLAAITIGGNIAGPIGMFLGVPVMSAIYILVKEATAAKAMQKKEVSCNE